ncbi:MAG: hypothetical protein ACLT4Y_10235 [Bifidobacterium breve]
MRSPAGRRGDVDEPARRRRVRQRQTVTVEAPLDVVPAFARNGGTTAFRA